MDMKKIAPWNWFKKEEEGATNVPIQRNDVQPANYEGGALNPIVQIHREMDRIFESALRGFGLSPFRSDFFTPLAATGLLKPQLDVGSSEKEYSITMELPGVTEKDVKIEIANNIMTIRGEKRQEKEEKDKNYYCLERSYGSFQRVLSLPEDANQEDIRATFKNGVLTINMQRNALPESEVKNIEVKSIE